MWDHWEISAQELAMASFYLINQTFLVETKSFYMQHPLEISKLVCHNLPEGALSQFRQPSSLSTSHAPLPPPTCDHTIPSWNRLYLIF